VSGTDKRTLFKEKNTLAVLNVLHQEHRISRADIARLTRLTPATISTIISRLEKFGIVQNLGLGQSKGGRRPMIIEFHPEAFYLAGVDIGVSKAVSLVIDLHGNVISRSRLDIAPEMNRESSLKAILNMTKEVFSSLKSAQSKIMGIGISIAGLVDPEKGIALKAPNLPEWHDTPLIDIFQKEFDLFCCLENDAKAMALGEVRLGAGRKCKNVFCALIGKGIGGGIIINGELYRGNHTAAGEFGHITVNHAGPVCNCGNRGCLEVMASGTAIAASAIRTVNTGIHTSIRKLVKGKIEKITAEVVATAARQGDEVALRLMNEAAQYIGIGLADVINLLSPEFIIIGGGVSGAGDFFIEEIKKTVEQRAFSYGLSAPEFALSTLGENASAIGAALLVMEKMINKDLPRNQSA